MEKLHKSDGTRLLVIKGEDQIRLQNRHGVDYTRRLPDVVEAAEHIPGTFTLDTEVVYINPKTGREEFTPCQRRCSTKDIAKILLRMREFPVTIKSFDILSLDGRNVEQVPWLKRKRLLWGLLDHHEGVFQYVRHRLDLEDFWEEVKEREGEGLILKDINSRYVHGRSYKWLKIKNWRWRVCDAVGYTPGTRSRAWFFGSIVLAEDGVFVGCAGSGPSDWELRQLKDIFTDAPKIKKPFDIGEPYTAIQTDLKVLVKYYQITERGVMRFPVFEEIVRQ